MTQWKRGIVARYLAVCGSAAGLALLATAQPTTRPSEKTPAPSQAKSQPQPETPPPEWGDARANTGPLITVEFPGGTVANFIEALRQAASPDPVNAVVSDTASRVVLAPVRLRKVALETAIQSIETAAGDIGSWRISRVRLERRDRDPLVGESPVFSVLFEPKRSSAARSADLVEKPMIQVYSLRDVTDPKPGDPPGVTLVLKPETVLTAIKSGIELASAESTPTVEIKYHQDSGLLIVRGSPEQTGLVQSTLNALEGDVRMRRASAVQMGVSGTSIADMRAQFEKANLMAMKEQAEAKRAALSLERVRSQANAGAIGSEEIAAAEARAQNAEIGARLAQVEVDRLAERLRSMEQQEGQAPRPADTAPRQATIDLSAWGEKSAPAGTALASALEKVSASVGKDHAASSRYDAKSGTCIVTAEPWGQELARRVLGEYARTNGLAFDGAARPGPDGAPGGRTDGGAPKKK